jgi:plastocyanin
MSLIEFLKTIIFFSITVFCQQLLAANLQVRVVDNNDKPIEFAVIYINEQSVKLAENTVIIDQVDKEFIPYVTAIRRGSAINFPNNDDIRHQVYSFSAPKHFELPLYNGAELSPVIFDKNGAVALACNIHDWMKAYVYVVDTDKFTLTDEAGQGVLQNLPNGEYEVMVWHPTQGTEPQSSAQKVDMSGVDQLLTFAITQKKQFKAWRAPKSLSRRGY